MGRWEEVLILEREVFLDPISFLYFLLLSSFYGLSVWLIRLTKKGGILFGKVTMKGVNITWLVMNEDVVSLFKSTWALSLCSIIGNNIALLVSGYRVSQEN